VKKAVRSTPSKKELRFRSFFGQTFNDAKSGGERVMDALRKTDIYTIDDIYALPDGERAE